MMFGVEICGGDRISMDAEMVEKGCTTRGVVNMNET